MKIITGTTDSRPESEFDSDSVLFFDIESTGLSKEYSNVYLIGCAFRNDGVWNIRQFLAENLREEEELVFSFLEFAKGFSRLVHFNGRHFDVPYIDHKAEQFDLPFRLSAMDNYDILIRARLAKKLLGMKNMSQKNVEAFLKIRRDDEMNGGILIPVYYDYQRTGDPRLEKLLLLHNYDDVQGMLKISPIVNYADICEGKFQVRKFYAEGKLFTMDISLSSAVPRPFEKAGEQYLLAGNGDFLQVVLTPYRGTAHCYLPDYKNYYYLPDEDRIIHKDLAQFVEKGHKVKATKKTCCLKKTSVFLPQSGELFRPAFCLPEEPKKKCFEAEALQKADEETLKQYVLEFINA